MAIGDQTTKTKKKPYEAQSILSMTELRWFALRITDSKRHPRDIYALMNNKKKVFLVSLQTGRPLIHEPVLTPALEQVESLKPAKLTAGTICAAPEWLEAKVAQMANKVSDPLLPPEETEEVPIPSLISDMASEEEEEEDEAATSGTEDSGKDGEGSGDVQGKQPGQA